MELIFRDDSYLRECSATVLSADPGGVRLDRTVFYPMGGGQPGDAGRLLWDGGETTIADTHKGERHDDVTHLPAEGAALPAVGAEVRAVLDWERRHRLMRMHTALHLLCSLVPGDVTGGQIGDGKSRLDFNIAGDQIDKEALQASLNAIVAADHAVRTRWISEEELAQTPELVRTVSVKPPNGAGRVRMVEIAGVDLQPCGGTHVRSTAEIGGLRIGKVENKGRQNRRINVHLDN